MAPRVIITRALPEALATAEHVRVRGGEPVLAPLLTIAPRKLGADLTATQALLFTSANGVRAAANSGPHRDIIALCVGDATAEAARAAGYKDVRSADGDSQALAALAIVSLDPKAGPLIHASGEHVAGDLVGALRAAGFSAERHIVYAARAAEAPPPALSQGADIILFHSARAAEIFLGLGAPGAELMTAGCLSAQVAQAALMAPWKRLIVAPRPRESALLAAILPSESASA